MFALVYSPAARADVATARLLLAEASNSLCATAELSSPAFADAQANWNAASQLVRESEDALSDSARCACCRVSAVYIDRWGGCPCDEGTCLRCNAD